MKHESIIFTDGSSRGNPGPGGWGAIILYEGKVVELGGREAHTTNNRMEMTAVLKALEYAKKAKLSKVTIYLDSSYVQKGASSWVHGWKKNGWKTATKADVINVDLWKKIDAVLPGFTIDWRLIKGHAGTPGNERCDEIATAFADNRKPILYTGPLKKYEVDISVASVSQATSNKQQTKSSSQKGPGYSYVSMVNGKVMTHATWAECEKRVKGVSGAKFKKAQSASDEKAIIASWKTSR